MPEAYATCGPGDGPDLERWPLLAWLSDKGVVTEDQQIPVAEIGEVAELFDDVETVAIKAGSTPEHIRQALDYLNHGALV